MAIEENHVKGLMKGLRKLDGWVKLPGSIDLVHREINVVMPMGIDITIDGITEVRIIEAIGIRERIQFKMVRRVLSKSFIMEEL